VAQVIQHSGDYIFLAILGITVFMQILMVEVFGDFAETTGLTITEWLSTIGLGALSLPVGFLLRLIPIDPTHGRITIPPRTFEGANLGDSPRKVKPLLVEEMKTNSSKVQHL